MVWENSWYDFNFLEFVEACFMSNHVVYLWKCPCTLEKNVYFASLGWKVLYVPVTSIWSRSLFINARSLLIFCLEDLSIFDRRVLKSPSISVLLSISCLKCSKIFLKYLGAPALGAYMFVMFMSSLWILPLSIMKCPSGSLFMALCFEVYFVRCKDCYSSCFVLSSCMENLFPAIHFQSV